MSSAKDDDLRLVRGRTTKAQLLSAAGDVLREEGYAGLSMRAVAERAGLQLSLVHYHFGSKRGLLIAVLEEFNAELLARQAEMFADDRPFAEQWRTACAYLREDVGSGYVRVLWELWVAGLADEELAERWRETQDRWRALIVERLERWRTERGVSLPFPPAALATLIGNLFEGAETEILAGTPETIAHQVDALEACAVLIEQAEKA